MSHRHRVPRTVAVVLAVMLPTWSAAAWPAEPAAAAESEVAALLADAAALTATVEEYFESEGFEEGRREKALEAARRALELREAALPPDDPLIADSLDNLVQVMAFGSEYEAGIPLLERALAIREQQFGPEHHDLEPALTALAGNHLMAHDFATAQPLLERALALVQAGLGPEDEKVGSSHDNLAYLLAEQGDYVEARSHYERALEIRERALGPNHEDVGLTLNNFAVLLEMKGEFEASEAAYRRALDLFERLDPGGFDVGMTLNNLAFLKRLQGNYAAAQPLYERSLAIWEVLSGADHPDVAISLSNLAFVLQSQGDFDAAVPLHERALAIRETTLGPDHPAVASSLRKLAMLRQEQGRFAVARPLMERALAILEKEFEPDHPRVGAALHTMATLLAREGDPAAALPFFERALPILESALGPDHPDVARCLKDEAIARQQAGDAVSARALLDRAVAILDATSGLPGARIAAYSARARLLEAEGDLPAALADLERALDAAEAMRPNIGGSEQTRAGFFERYADDFDTMVGWQIEAGDLATAYAYAERGRGRTLLDQLAASQVDLRASIPADLRRELEAEEIEIRGRLASLQKQLTNLRSRQDLAEAEKLADIESLAEALRTTDAEYEAIYSKIKNASPLWRSFVTTGGRPVPLSQVQRTLVPRDGLILLYEIGAEASYLLLIPEAGQPVEAFALERTNPDGGTPEPLESTALQALLLGADGHEALLAALSTPEGVAPQALQDLYEILIPAGARQRVMTAAEVVIVPDASLHLLPFEALVLETTPLRYWLDDGPVVRYTPSVTALGNIVDRSLSIGSSTVLSVSDPVYDPADLQPLVAVADAELPGIGPAAPGGLTRARYERVGGSLARLPGTGEETRAIVRTYGDDAVTVLTRSAATESAVRRSLGGQRILHLATHGLVDEKRGSLFASLALTPAGDDQPGSDADGYLQLHEIYELPLADTGLVVLSACDGNVGEHVAGEGVFALSRGFLAAGARRVVASHWAVDDASTAVLVSELFERLAEMERAGSRVDHGSALREARRSVRAHSRWSSPYFWAPFILTGAP